MTTDRPDDRPCKGTNSNVCVAEGCYGEACTRRPDDRADEHFTKRPSDQPMVHADFNREPTEFRSLQVVQLAHYSSPGINLHVEFRLGDHEAALELLNRAVLEVKAQIEKTVK